MNCQKYILNILLLLLGFVSLGARAAPETRVVWSQEPCPVSTPADSKIGPLAAALAIAIGQKVIDAGVDAAAVAIKKAGEKHDYSSSNRSGENFYLVNRVGDLLIKYKCLYVVRGTFEKNPLPAEKQARTAAKEPGLATLSDPLFQFAARIDSVDANYIRLVPNFLRVDKFEDESWWPFGSAPRDYSISLSLSVPGAASPFASITFLFPEIPEKTELTWPNSVFANAESEPFSVPPPSADAKNLQTKRQQAYSPFLQAIDIIKSAKLAAVAPAIANSPPSIYLAPAVIAAATTYCGNLQQYNSLLVDSAKISDDRCKNNLIAVSSDKLDEALSAAKSNSARNSWALLRCGKLQSAAAWAAAHPAPPPQPGVPPKSVPPDPSAKEDRCANDTDTPGFEEVTFVTTTVTLTETRPENKFLTTLGDALGAAKADVSAALAKQILPKSDAEKAAAEALSTEQHRAKELADLAVTQAEQQLSTAVLTGTPADITSARIVLFKAKAAANDAYRNIPGLGIPYPEAY